MREPSRVASSWRAKRSLEDELRAYGVVGIAVQGTRALTRHLRDRGAMRAGISTEETEPAALLDRVLASPDMIGADLARVVSTAEPYVVRPEGEVRHRVAAIDLGIKTMTPRRMAERGCEVHVLPATATAGEILALEPDGVFYSNGPGDPAACDYAVDLDAGRPGRGPARLRHLPGQPDPRPRARPGHLQAAVRPPRGQPARAGPRHRPGAHHQPQPRLRRRGAPRRPVRDARTAAPRSATSTSTTAWSRACGCSTVPRSASSTTPRPRPARTTPPASSTTFCELMSG